MLGLDLGTSRLKAMLRAPDGTVLGRGVADYQVSAPRPGWAETDPEQWWQAARTAVRSALGYAAPGSARAEVSGLAIVGQMHGLILYSERAGVLRPAIVWLDRRATAEVADYLRLPERLRASLGNAPSPGMAGPLLLWLSRHEPDAYRRARWMLQPKDWLRLRLTGQAATDPTDASGTLLYDLGRGAWAPDVAEALGLRADLLPPIRPTAQQAGTLLPAPAGQLGLPPGLPVATGAADTASSLLAAGLGPAWALLTIGTGGQWIIPGGGAPDRSGGTNLFRSADGGTYRLGGAQNVGVTLDWVRRTLGASWDELYRTAELPWRADTPVFLPYLADERGEHREHGGAWAGLTLRHQRDDLMRAALEGVAFLLRAKLDRLRAVGGNPAHVMLAGGGTEHPAWRQLLADVLSLPLHPAADGWLTVHGAALIAGGSTQARSDQVSPAVVAGPSAGLAEQSYRRFRSSALPPLYRAVS